MSKLLKRQRGFTLIELLIVIAIIGIIAALLIPNFLDALHKAKQKQTMGDEKDMGTAWFSWFTDQFGAAAAAGTPAVGVTLPSNNYGHAALKGDLVPQYIQDLKEKDGWQNLFQYCRPATVAEMVSVDNLQGEAAMAIISAGRKDITYSCGNTITAGTFDPTDYDQDIVWADGFFVRYPQKTNQGI